MTLVAKDISKFENEHETDVLERSESSTEKDEMTIVMRTVTTQQSTMPEEMKNEKRKEVDSLERLFHQVIEEKGEADHVKLRRSSANEFEVEGLSNLALHSFLLKAEGLGKNITYTKSMQVKISG